ncbi:unnamed protein product [Prorocentrum cordatum]|uniref:Uncharacterized protein n=1 Tax=Prorocentrum cordatum TaxID=2364126 RepID=A0ABN9SJZ2_9DINO|nr:unnamed protein product [Polarella glacialis]
MWSTRSAGSPAPAVSLGRRALACARGGGRALGARRLPEATRRGGRSAGAPRKRHVRCQRSGKEGERERGERNKEGEERKRKRERERECERRLSPQLTTAPLAPQTARRHSRGLHVTRPGRRGSVQQGDAEASPGAGKARMAARWWHRTTVHAPVRREGPHQLAGTRQHWRWCPEHPRPSGESFEKTCPGATGGRPQMGPNSPPLTPAGQLPPSPLALEAARQRHYSPGPSASLAAEHTRRSCAARPLRRRPASAAAAASAARAPAGARAGQPGDGGGRQAAAVLERGAGGRAALAARPGPSPRARACGRGHPAANASAAPRPRRPQDQRLLRDRSRRPCVADAYIM